MAVNEPVDCVGVRHRPGLLPCASGACDPITCIILHVSGGGGRGFRQPPALPARLQGANVGVIHK
jgi:hypothetical protein